MINIVWESQKSLNFKEGPMMIEVFLIAILRLVKTEDTLNFNKSAAMILIFTISISILSWAEEDFDLNFGG